MKGTAHQALKSVVSIAQNLTDADSQPGAAIDCLGYDEALLELITGQFGGTADPTLIVKWQESDDGVTWADITGAVHPTVLFDNNLIVASVNLTNALTATIAAQPAKPSRIAVVITDTTSSITTGTVYITGTREANEQAGEVGDQAVAELLTYTSSGTSNGKTLRTTALFKTVTAVKFGLFTDITGTIDFATLGGSGDETVIVGVDNSGPSCPQVGRLNLINRKRYIAAYSTKGGSSPAGTFVAKAVLTKKHKLPVVQVVPISFNVV
jgi:hypothetical protein